MDILVFVEGPQKGQRYPIESGRVTLGRDRQNDIPIDDASSSRTHAQIQRVENGLRLTDMKSTNGTFLNSRRVTDCMLQHGDRIAIGDTVMIVESTPVEETPSVMVSEDAHDCRKDITVEMNSTALLKAVHDSQVADARQQDSFVKLFNFMTTITGVLVLDRLLPLALAEICRNMGADRGAILFLSKTDELSPKTIWPSGS
ncbi:MAG: FHA domain-containing protein, partial [Planctomycetes bacterium]|nr:FHA domain-containing protein [Planctomycetota bacterium]